VTATFYLYEQLAEVRSTMSLLAECSKSVMVRGTWIVMCIVILCSQVSYTIVLPSSKKTFLPLGAIYVALGPAHVIAKSAGMFIDYMHYASYLAFIGGISSHIVVIGRLIEDRSFWWKMAIWVVTNGVLTMVIEFMLWPSVPDWTDIDKALFVIIFAPILTEVALTIGRFVSRAIPKRHEAAGWVLNGYMLAIKNVQVRLIIALIESPLVILLASSIQVPNNLYNDERDRFLYNVWARLHPQQTDKEGRFQERRYTESDIGDPTRIARNRTLRVRLLHVETTVEIICTVVSAFIVLNFGISLNGRDPPAVQNVLLNTAIQLGAECAHSLLCNLFYVVVLRHPAVSVPLLRMRGFSLVLTMIVACAWGTASAVAVPVTLGHRADSSSKWVFLTKAFNNDLNISRLCATFPEASGFAGVQDEC